LPQFVGEPPTDPAETPVWTGEVPWLEPYPDRLLDEDVDGEDAPELAIGAGETIELAFLVALQWLPARRRAGRCRREVRGRSARETAAMLEMSVIAGNSALQRARETLREHLPERREDWRRSRLADPREREVLARYLGAWERTDPRALAALLKEDVRLSMPPSP